MHWIKGLGTQWMTVVAKSLLKGHWICVAWLNITLKSKTSPSFPLTGKYVEKFIYSFLYYYIFFHGFNIFEHTLQQIIKHPLLPYILLYQRTVICIINIIYIHVNWGITKTTFLSFSYFSIPKHYLKINVIAILSFCQIYLCIDFSFKVIIFLLFHFTEFFSISPIVRI